MPDAAQTTPEPRTDWMAQHLDELFHPVEEYDHGLRLEIRCINPTTRGVGAETFATTKQGRAAAVEFARSQNLLGMNCYVGVNPRKKETPPIGAAKAQDVEPVFFWVFADADTPEAVEALRANPGVACTMLISTGLAPTMRVHCYWQLDLCVSNDAAWTNLQKHLQLAFGGDSVHDTPRIMRLAGSVSYPTEKKAAKGYRVELVQIKTFHDRHLIDPMEILAIPLPENVSHETNAPGVHDRPPASGLYLHQPSTIDQIKCRAEIAQGIDLHNNARDLVAVLVGQGQADELIVGYMQALLAPVSDGGTIDEVPGLIASARVKWNRPDPGTPQPATINPQNYSQANSAQIVDLTIGLGDPPPRRWVIQDWLAQGVVNSLYGDGGVGKTLLAQQLGACVATAMPFLGLQVVTPMPVFAVLCEDDKDEVQRRSHSIIKGLGVHIGMDEQLKRCRIWPRTGEENFLLQTINGIMQLTPFYQTIREHLDAIGPDPKLLILDTLADMFAGSEIDRVQVNYFVKTTLGRLAIDHNCTVLLLAHPSLSGMQSGSQLSGSTAWNNAVRSRLSLRRPDDEDEADDLRILGRPKSNYAKAEEEIVIEYSSGMFKPLTVATSSMEIGLIERSMLDEIAKQASRETPLHYSMNAGRPYLKHLTRCNGKALTQKEKTAAVEALIDQGMIRNGRLPKCTIIGLHPIETKA